VTKYNYEGFSSNTYNLNSFSDPDLGSKAPDFLFSTVDNKIVNLLDFTGKFLRLEENH
jgi:hypothetical protein